MRLRSLPLFPAPKIGYPKGERVTIINEPERRCNHAILESGEGQDRDLQARRLMADSRFCCRERICVEMKQTGQMVCGGTRRLMSYVCFFIILNGGILSDSQPLVLAADTGDGGALSLPTLLCQGSALCCSDNACRFRKAGPPQAPRAEAAGSVISLQHPTSAGRHRLYMFSLPTI